MADLFAAMREPASLSELNRQIASSPPPFRGSIKPVFGEGKPYAHIVFVGEQPGDREDIEGRPFVGPAGQLLDRALREAGIDRKDTYVTNAVKHFKYTERGKKRLHQSPTAGEIKHYRWWLLRELDLVHPRVVVALGASAVLGLTGHALAIGRNRGVHELAGRPGFITVHPSYLLRVPDEAARTQAYHEFVSDLCQVRDLAQKSVSSVGM